MVAWAVTVSYHKVDDLGPRSDLSRYLANVLTEAVPVFACYRKEKNKKKIMHRDLRFFFFFFKTFVYNYMQFAFFPA